MCAKTYKNILYENSTKTVPPPIETRLNSSALDADKMSISEACDLGHCSQIPNNPNITVKYMRLTPEDPASPLTNHSFGFNKMDFLNLGAYFVELFSVSWGTSVNTRQMGQASRPIPDWSPDPGNLTPMMAQFLADSPDINQTMRNIAESMSEVVRTGANGTTAPGRTYSNTTFIQVRWAWLAVPVSLMVMSIILLMIVIMQTHVKDAAVWKSSSLALLFHQLDGWDVPAGSVTDRHTLERMARKMKGQLRDDIGHPAFVREAGTGRIPEAEPLAHHNA